MGRTIFRPWERIWKSWAPAKCRFFLWLVAHKRCWTSDRLARRGLPHPEQCPLCDQADETIDHLLVACVFSRQFWYYFLRQVGLHSLAPQPSDTSFDDWWENASTATSGLTQKGLNSLIVLGAWVIWNHRNRCVFDGAVPNIAEALEVSWRGASVVDFGRGSWAIPLDCPCPSRLLICLKEQGRLSLIYGRVCFCCSKGVWVCVRCVCIF